MADTHDDLAARRWFRQRRAELAEESPQLTTPESQKRLDAALAPLLEEDTLCPDNPPDGP
jgi:hypothetical protein